MINGLPRGGMLIKWNSPMSSARIPRIRPICNCYKYTRRDAERNEKPTHPKPSRSHSFFLYVSTSPSSSGSLLYTLMWSRKLIKLSPSKLGWWLFHGTERNAGTERNEAKVLFIFFLFVYRDPKFYIYTGGVSVNCGKVVKYKMGLTKQK